MFTRCLLAAVLLLVFEGVSATTQFAVITGPSWSPCRAINSTQACYRTRNVVCVRTSDNLTAPWYYCPDAGRSRPPTIEVCSEGDCVQDCVVTEWDEWSSCDCGTSFYRIRTRDIIVPSRNGGVPCPYLQDRDNCSACISNALFDSLPRQYTWRTGIWETCSPLDTTKTCGPGLQERAVDCVGLDGRKVHVSKCLSERAYSTVLPPGTSRLCHTPCDCIVSAWSDWSTTCQSVCEPETRTRSVLQYPTDNGNECPVLSETRVCSDTPPHAGCPNYSWSTSDWSTCQYITDATCGAGHRTRFVYCVKELNGTSQNVDASICDELVSTPRPTAIMSCTTVCPQACVLGAWSQWSECSPSCNITHSNRTRDVLVPPQGNEETCPHTIELRSCPVSPCVRWSPEPYSDCYVNPMQGCGEGIQSRSIQCNDVHGNTIDYSMCRDLPQIDNVQSCYVPCPEDCVISDWSEWTSCNQSCGQEAGVQTRTRRLVAVGNNCTYSEDDFIETQSCSSPFVCESVSYHVKTGQWSECTEAPMSSGDSPNFLVKTCGLGIENRTSLCLYGDHVISPEDCPIEFTQMKTRSCDLACTNECVYSSWTDFSECSVRCGSGTRTRSRQLLQFPESPKEECTVDDNGLQVETESCDMPVCAAILYEWVGDDWSDCVLLPSLQSASTVNPATNCGHGYQTTPLTCVNIGTGVPVSNDLCVQMTPPPSIQPCIIACPNRCIVTEWTEWSVCENGSYNRTRDIIPFASSNHWTDSCPDISSIDLIETSVCSDITLEEFDYSILSIYTSTIIKSPIEVCGNGEQFRLVACINMFTLQLHDDEYCSHQTPDDSTRRTSIKCQTDCVQSEWSDWSSCSSSCGYGNRTRNRQVLREPLEGGQPCGSEREVNTCYTQPCLFPEYKPGPYSICHVTNTSSICGRGTRTREPLCFVNGKLQDSNMECENQGTPITFDLSESCDMPCPGECVVSEWGEFGPCQTDCHQSACQRSRHRTRLRTGTYREECYMTQQFELCEPEQDPHRWSVGGWTDCILGPVDGELNTAFYCGTGVQQGVVECVNTATGQRTYDDRCLESNGPKPLDFKTCNIPCPVDCAVSAFSEWSACPEGCEQNLERSRSRSIVIDQMHGGRMCPELEQHKPCLPTNCTVYAIEGRESHCEADLTPASQCGSSQLSNPLSCRRNTRYVDMSVCLDAIDENFNVIGSNLLSDEPCTLSCPMEPNCTYTEWSEWSECVSLCVDSNVAFSFRNRTLMSSLDGRLTECERGQYETRECDNNNSTDLVPFNTSLSQDCISLQWKTNDYALNGTREVWCQTNTGIRVVSGCSSPTPPSTRPSCDQTICSTHSSCNSDSYQCECLPMFEKVQNACLPMTGCTENSHCLYPHTLCNGRTCECKESFEMMNGRCEYTGPVTTLPVPTTTELEVTEVTTIRSTPISMETDPVTMTTNTTSPTSETDMTTVVAPSDALGILPIALIATVPLVLIIITVAILIFVMYRCRKGLERKQPTDSDSLKRRVTNVSISAPSPVHSDHYGGRGADSASSGFVDDVEHDQLKYGLAGKTFLGTHPLPPTSREDIDEAVFSAEFPVQGPTHVRPIPVSAPSLPGYQLEHIVTPDNDKVRRYVTDLPEGDFTTDVTYTTDDGSLVTTSVPPSSVGSPNVQRRHAHQNAYMDDGPSHVLPAPSESTYISMHPIYSKVVPRSQRSHDYRDESHDWDRVSHDYRDRLHSSGSHDYRDKSYDYRDYREVSRDYRGRSHDHRERSRSSGRDYRERGSYERERGRYYEKASREQSLERHEERSPTPPRSPTGPSYYSPRSDNSRDRRIATGLDNSLVQAIAQMGPTGNGDHTPSVHSVQSSGSRASHRRRSGRRRRYHGHPHHMTNHHSNRYRYNSDGPSDQDHYTSASEAEQQSYSRRAGSRSVPISPIQHDPDEPDYDTLPPPHVQVQPATPPNRGRRAYTPEHVPTSRIGQLKIEQEHRSHYDYPRRCYPPSHQSPSSQGSSTPPSHVAQQSYTLSPPSQVDYTQSLPSHVDYTQSPPSQVAQSPPIPQSFTQSPPSQVAQSPPALQSFTQTAPSQVAQSPPIPHSFTQSPPSQLAQSPPSQVAQSPSTKATRYEHLTPLNLSPSNQTPETPGSPFANRRQYPPSPLALHSNSFSENGGGTPRSSGEVNTFGHPNGFLQASDQQHGTFGH